MQEEISIYVSIKPLCTFPLMIVEVMLHKSEPCGGVILSPCLSLCMNTDITWQTPHRNARRETCRLPSSLYLSLFGRFRIKHICQRLSIPAKQTIERNGKRILDYGRKLDQPLNLIFDVVSALLYILKKAEQQLSTKHPTKQRKGAENDDPNAKVLTPRQPASQPASEPASQLASQPLLLRKLILHTAPLSAITVKDMHSKRSLKTIKILGHCTLLVQLLLLRRGHCAGPPTIIHYNDTNSFL
uniref:Uncharacterized protein n=1 Tax=Glossina palpalis gambiensis TaxID=67801 RepID=A0A1B0ATN6_9MUSC